MLTAVTGINWGDEGKGRLYPKKEHGYETFNRTNGFYR